MPPGSTPPLFADLATLAHRLYFNRFQPLPGARCHRGHSTPDFQPGMGRPPTAIAIPRVLCFGDGRLWYEHGDGLVRADTSKDAGTLGTKTITSHSLSTCHGPSHELSSQRYGARDAATIHLLLSHANLQDPEYDNDKPMGQHDPILVLDNPDCSENSVKR